jgi:putative membrane protein
VGIDGRNAAVEYIKNIIKGAATGIAMLVPGVSGGTMAIILGIYDKMIHSVSSFFQEWKKNLLFLLQVGAGGVLGVLLFGRIMENAMASIPHIMKFLFAGFIVGGLPVLYRKSVSTGKGGASDLIFAVIGFVIVLLMASEPEAVVNMASASGILGFVFLVAAGLVIAIGFVLPGISTSFMLLVLGLYEITLGAINTVNIPFLIPLGLGVAGGTIGTAKIIEKLLAKYPRKMYLLIIGFVVGSLIEVYPGMPAGWQLPASVAAFVSGFVIMFIIGEKGMVD